LYEGAWKARKEVGEISPPIGTLLKDGEVFKRGSKEVCVYSENSI
jgi:hypothetical protein